MTTFPRSKADELQEARNHLEYYRWKGNALVSAQARIHGDLALCAKEGVKWAKQVEKLEGKKE
jgi:hypothetical protein